MSKEALEVLISHALRWCTNILVELNSNYAHFMTVEARDGMRKAITELSRIDQRPLIADRAPDRAPEEAA